MTATFHRCAVTLALAAAIAACAPAWRVGNYTSHDALFRAALAQYEKRNWNNAVEGFERLTIELPARDTLLPRSYFYLALAHEKRKEHLLAAQTFMRLAESFPGDTLADDAMLRAGRAYGRLWRKPALDAQYGEIALRTLQTFLAAFPSSPLRPEAEAEIARLEQWFATKDYESGMHYLRRRAYDSAIIYFEDIVEKYPGTPRARDAYLRLAEVYDRIRYREDMREICETLRTRYPGDSEVRERCGEASAAAAPTP